MTGGLMGFSERSDSSRDFRDSQTFNSLEAPIILGVAVVGLLVGCALYHMCYRKLCMSRHRGRIFYSRNRGPSTNELRTRRTMVSEILQQSHLEEGRFRQSPSSNSLPDYNDLPPSYSNATKMLPKPSKSSEQTIRTSVISSSSEDPPPAYDECKEEEALTSPQ